MDDRSLSLRIERVGALNAVALSRVLSRQDPSWGTETFPLGDGHAVLSGPGLYVNQVQAAGVEQEVTDDDLDRLEQRSRHVGVQPAFEVSELTRGSVVRRLVKRGYQSDSATNAMVRRLDELPAEPDVGVDFHAVDEELLPVWLETTALGWGHTTDEARRASDAWSRAAFEADEPGLLLARSTDHGRPVGCATLAIRDGVATLGGMSTPPAERGRGVQTALIVYRLRFARERGCDVATTQVIGRSASERNLLRHGVSDNPHQDPVRAAARALSPNQSTPRSSAALPRPIRVSSSAESPAAFRVSTKTWRPPGTWG